MHSVPINHILGMMPGKKWTEFSVTVDNRNSQLALAVLTEGT